MASFCKQCSDELFGKDFQDLAGLTTAEDWNNNQAAVVLCEGCGPIQVDPDGVCNSYDCEKHGVKDWTCTYCHTVTGSADTHCVNCGRKRI